MTAAGVLCAALGVCAGAGPASAATGKAGPAVMYGQEIVLPFTGIDEPWEIALDSSGDVYVTDYGINRVLELPAGSSQQIQVPFTGLTSPNGVAVDASGDVYITDGTRVLELPAGSSQQITLPFTGLGYLPLAMAVDSHGNVYVADTANNRIVELPAGATSPSQQITLPFAHLDHPFGVAVDAAGNVYATSTDNNEVFELPAGARSPSQQITLPFTGLNLPQGVAVDGRGNVYVADGDSNRVLELPAGATSSSQQVTLPFTDMSVPEGVAVDAKGDVFVVKFNPQQVVELPVTTDAVTVTNPGDQASQADQTVSLQIHASSSTNTALTYSAANLPPGLTINKTTGLISGRLQMVASTLREPVTVTAVAADHGFATTTFTWAVTPVTGHLHGYRNECAADYRWGSSSGTPVVIQTCSSLLRETWTLGPDHSLMIRGLCLTDPGSGRWGTRLTLEACQGSASQQWSHQTNGQYVVAIHQLCLTDPRWSTTSGTQLILQSCRDWRNQRWSQH